MLNEEKLTRSAGTSCAFHTQALETAMPEDFAFSPSTRFTRRMQKLKRRSAHPTAYRVLTRAAAFFLALLTAGTIWLSVDAQARKAVYGWIQRIYQNSVRVIFTSKDKDFAVTSFFVLENCPEGYTPYEVQKTDTGVYTLYRDENYAPTRVEETNEGEYRLQHGCHGKEFISIQCSTDSAYSFIHSTNKFGQIAATVNGEPAMVFISGDPYTSNSIIWSVDDKVFFHIAGFFDQDELVALAESVVSVSYEETKDLGFR